MNDNNLDPNNIADIGRINEPDLSDYNPLQEKIEYLEARIKILGDICTEINPYEPISDELKMRLMDFNILGLDDPFKVTNSLLMLLEDTIDELHVLKPFDEKSSPVKEIF
ncbi:MAG: hypothetical protein H7336_14585 [Bacteriovorax sp.]|nr:hypothetical protein [Bacteriovorax sp.]